VGRRFESCRGRFTKYLQSGDFLRNDSVAGCGHKLRSTGPVNSPDSAEGALADVKPQVPLPSLGSALHGPAADRVGRGTALGIDSADDAHVAGRDCANGLESAIPIVARRSSGDGGARHPLVAIGIAPVTAEPAIPSAA
jgi:hypothetical protein